MMQRTHGVAAEILAVITTAVEAQRRMEGKSSETAILITQAFAETLVEMGCEVVDEVRLERNTETGEYRLGLEWAV